MEATQMISDSFLESDEEEKEEENENKRGQPLARLCVLKNAHIPETELPLYLGDNVLGRDPKTCNAPLPATSVSKQHATICISVYRRRGRRSEGDIEALVWDLGSMNGTRKGRLKLSPNVRYALCERDTLVVADIPCQYVSCAADTVSSEGDNRTLVSRNSGLKAGMPSASGENGGDTSTGSKTFVNGGTKASVTTPDLEDTRKTPARTTCLSFEQTPTQPEGTLVPESDSDSEGEGGGGGDRRRKALVSDSDSYKSSPTCSTFLSPTNKIVPESEDESPITPSLSAKNKPHRHVSFSSEETDVDAGRRQLKDKKALGVVDDSEEEEERASPAGRESATGSGQRVPLEHGSSVSLTGDHELSASKPAVITDAIPEFNMDSDTDVEEEVACAAGPLTSCTNQQAACPPHTAQFHMDSDTDLDEDDDALVKVPKQVPSSAEESKPVISVIHPEGIMMDSDTDLDDDVDGDSAPSTLPKDFHLDSDTDVDEEEEREHETDSTCSEIEQSPTRLVIKPIGAESVAASNDNEATAAPAIDIAVDFDILSDSDTEVIPLVVSILSDPGSDSDADTDVDESSLPPAVEGGQAADLRVDSDTDVDDVDVDVRQAGEDKIPSLRREKTPGFLPVPLLLNCSTPVQVSEGEVEEMATQAFLSPASGPLSSTVAPVVRPKAPPSWSDSQEDEDFVVAETQSFVLQSRACEGNPPEDHSMEPTQAFGLELSGDERGEQPNRRGFFQLGSSNSSHLQHQAQALAMENTQAFFSVVGGGGNLEGTQAAFLPNADRTSTENAENLDATQAYGESEEPDSCSVVPEKAGQVDLDLEETQAYISETYSDSEDETHEDEGENTQPTDLPIASFLAVAETLPMSAYEMEESFDNESPDSSVLQVHPDGQNEGEESEVGEPAPPQERHLSEALSVAQTQPMCASYDEDSDDEEDSIISSSRKGKAKPLKPEEEAQTQLFTGSGLLSLVETQPLNIDIDKTRPTATSGNEESAEEETQPLSVYESSAIETHGTGQDGEESDEEDSMPGPRKRRAKQLPLEEEETQTLTNSDLSIAATQPMGTGEGGESDDGEHSFPGPRKRRGKPRRLEEESQPLASSQVSAVETLPTLTGESDEEEDSIPGTRKSKAKPRLLRNPKASTVETKAKADPRPQRGKGRQPSEAGTSGTTIRGERETRAILGEEEEEEEEQAKCSEPPRRQTRGRNKAPPATGGRRGKLRPDEDGSEEEEEEEAKRARGKKSTRIQKGNEETEERLATERNKLEKEQERLERDKEEKEEQERQQAENTERLRIERERAEKDRIENEGKEQEAKEKADRIKREREEQLERERKEMEEREKLERERAEREEEERLEKEEKERKEQEEQEKADRLQREKEEQLERERKEKEERERLEHEKAEREEKERLEKEEKERKDQEEKERLETEKRELEEILLREREERERLQAENAERIRLEQERIEKERKEQEEKEKADRLQMEKEEQLERERKEKEEREKIEREKAERKEKERLEKEEKERKEQEEQEKADRLQRDKEEQLERERKEREERERLEREKAEREVMERKEKEEKERIEREQEERERLETAKRELKERLEREEREERARLEREERERLEKERQETEAKEKQIKPEKEEEENQTKASARSRRVTRRTTGAAPSTTQESTVSAYDDDDVPARRTRSRSNSSNSVSSERSASSSVITGPISGRGRGTGAKRATEPPPTPVTRASNRRRTVAAGPTEQDGDSVFLSRSNSNNSLNSDMSSCSVSSQARGRGRGGKQRGRGRNTEPQPESIPPISSQQSDQTTPVKPTARGRRSRGAAQSSSEVTHDHDEEKADSQQASCTTRGRRRANATGPEPLADGEEEGPSNQEEGHAPVVADGDEAREKRKGRKSVANTEEASSSTLGNSKGMERAQAAEEVAEKVPVQAKRRCRASNAQAKKNVKDSPTEVEVTEDSEKMEEEAVGRRGRGRPSAVQKRKKQEQEGRGRSASQDASIESSEPSTPTSSGSRKRQAPVDFSPVAKTPRSSSASPASSARLRAASLAYKVQFTGVVDEAGERVLARLGGYLAKGVADMNCLVTDKVRRTVKFLCAVAKGVPIVTTHWLEKSGKAGSFLSPDDFLVKDPEQEEKFHFCLQESLRIASSQPLLQGYEIHVTKSVKPEPVQMKDIISCSGATFLSKMPSSHKPQTVVISCDDDWSLCRPALAVSLPVVTAEFILTGILQQKLDFQTHALAANDLQPAGGRGRSRKKN